MLWTQNVAPLFSFQQNIAIGTTLCTIGIGTTAVATYKHLKSKKNQNKKIKQGGLKNKKIKTLFASGVITSVASLVFFHQAYCLKQNAKKVSPKKTSTNISDSLVENKEDILPTKTITTEEQKALTKKNTQINAYSQEEKDYRATITQREEGCREKIIKTHQDALSLNTIDPYVQLQQMRKIKWNRESLPKDEQSQREALAAEESDERAVLTTKQQEHTRLVKERYQNIKIIEDYCNNALEWLGKGNLSFGQENDQNDVFKQVLTNAVNRSCSYQEKLNNLFVLQEQIRSMSIFYERHRSALNAAHGGNTPLLGNVNNLDCSLCNLL
jgi:hypothetical protein